MVGRDGVQDLFVFNSDFNKDYDLSSSDFAYIYSFKRNEDKIVIIDSDGGGFVEEILGGMPNDECAAICGCDCPLVDSYFEFVEAGSSLLKGAGYSSVSGIVANSLIDWDDIIVTADMNYGGLIWA
jgi:hypothetical protein